MKQITVPEVTENETVFIVKTVFTYFDSASISVKEGTLYATISDCLSGLDLSQILAYRRYYEYVGPLSGCEVTSCYPFDGQVYLIESFEICDKSNSIIKLLSQTQQDINTNQEQNDYGIIFFDEKDLVKVYSFMAKFKAIKYKNIK